MKTYQYPGIRVQQVKDAKTRTALQDADNHLRSLWELVNAAASTDHGPGYQRVVKPVVLQELPANPTTRSTRGTPGQLGRVQDSVFMKTGRDGEDTDWVDTQGGLALKADKVTLMIAGAGLVGGGSLAASRTFDVGAGAGIIVDANSVRVDSSAIPFGSGASNKVAKWISASVVGAGSIDDDGVTLDMGPAITTTNIYGETTIQQAPFTDYLGATLAVGSPFIAQGDIYMVAASATGPIAVAGKDVYISSGTGFGVGVDGQVILVSGGALPEVRIGPNDIHFWADGAYRFRNPSNTFFNGELKFDSISANRVYTFPDASGTLALTSGTPLAGNPISPSVKLAVDNGVAGTFMRSDAVLAIDQSIVPTWTGVHTFTARSVHELGITLGKSGVAGDGRINSVTPDGSGVTSILLQPSVAITADQTRYVARILDSTATYGLAMYGDFSWVFLGNTGSNLAGGYINVTGAIGHAAGISFSPAINAATGATFGKASSIVGAQFVASASTNLAPTGYIVGGYFAAKTTSIASGNNPTGYVGGFFQPASSFVANSGKTFAELGGWRVVASASPPKNSGTFTESYGGYVENEVAMTSGSVLTNRSGLIIEEQTRGGTTNNGIKLLNATAGYKAITIRDQNAWIGSSAAATLTLAGTTVEVNIGGNIELSFAANATTVRDAHNFILNATTGTKIGTATTQKLGLWNAAPVAQYATTGTLTGFTANTTTPVLDGSTFTGNTGATAYTIGDIVRALKLAGIMAS